MYELCFATLQVTVTQRKAKVVIGLLCAYGQIEQYSRLISVSEALETVACCTATKIII